MVRPVGWLGVVLLLALLSAASAFAAAPVIESIGIIRTADREGPSWVLGWDVVRAEVTDGDGYGDIAAVTITDPAGATHDFVPGSAEWHQYDDYRLRLMWYPEAAPGPPAPGAYAVTARDAAGHETALTTPALPANEDFPVLSPARDGVTTDTTPTFSWTAPEEAQVNLTLEEEAQLGTSPVWQANGVTGGQIEYNADGQASLPALRPGYSYLLRLHYYTEESLPDARVRLLPSQYVSSRFTVLAAGVTTPTLAGTLAYGVCFDNGWDGAYAVLQYEPDSSVRHWLGPVEALYPSLSPDGRVLLYPSNELVQPFLDRLDGSQPEVVPGILSAESRWSPDGTHIVFRDAAHGSYDGGWLWTVALDGSDAHQLTNSPYSRWPDWSPDGQWIAYRDGDGAADSLHLIRPDGTEGHALSITGVAGYPGATVTYSGEPSWSPDSERLVTVFRADDGAGGTLDGLGLVSRDGGLLTPLLLDDADHVCCAASGMPVWSPNGKQIVFASGRHLDPNPDWSAGWFESGVELWVMNADGSGEPRRLTYDHFFPYYVTWSIPHTFTDVRADFWAFDAIEACAKAGLVVGYKDGTYQPKWQVNRGQMAAFLARAMREGEGNIPTGPATATFPDVPTDFPFFRHVEYAYRQGVVKGFKDGTYQPGWTVSRGQMAAFLARALCGGEEHVPTGPAQASFSDVALEFPFYKHIEYIYGAGVTVGYKDGTYHPEYECKRDQMAVFLARAFALLP